MGELILVYQRVNYIAQPNQAVATSTSTVLSYQDTHESLCWLINNLAFTQRWTTTAMVPLALNSWRDRNCQDFFPPKKERENVEKGFIIGKVMNDVIGIFLSICLRPRLQYNRLLFKLIVSWQTYVDGAP